MNFGLVHASCSLPKWRAVKVTFYAPCTRGLYLQQLIYPRETNNYFINQKQMTLKHLNSPYLLHAEDFLPSNQNHQNFSAQIWKQRIEGIPVYMFLSL